VGRGHGRDGGGTPDAEGQPFVSDLSASEFLLTSAAGFRPNGLVFGCSVFHAGTTPRRPTQSSEVDSLSQALYTARQDAIRRMEEEADALGASGVVGVRLTLSTSDWSRKSVDFIAVGTAVTAVDGGDWRTKDGTPFTSDLSGQGFWTLTRAGYRPLGFVMGTCVYHVGRRRSLTALGQTGRSTEQASQTQALYTARELAMTRMQEEGSRLGATGMIGSRITESSQVWHHRFIEFLAIGTAIAPRDADGTPPNPRTAVSVDH
jgi:uncharacterized protein YbjQ (UPF0145 family)